MQEFNKVSTTSNFIKELLNTTYLPVIRTVQAGDYIIEDRTYIYKCEIIRCDKTGYVLPYPDATLSPKAVFHQIGEYTFGEQNGKLCTNFTSNHEGYDSLTHERLGDYLRALRDMYGLNLMPMYNCFSRNSFAKYHIFSDGVRKTHYNYHTKLYKVPIRFNTDYTICIENVGKTTFAPAFVRNEHLVVLNKTSIGDSIDVTNRYISLHTNDVISTYSGMRFFDPIVVRFNNIPETRTVKYMVSNTDDVEYTAVGLHTIDGSMNPNALGWYVRVGNNYTLTEDTVVDLSKTYYIKTDALSTSYYNYNIKDIHCEMFDAIEDMFYMLIQVPDSFDSNIVVLEGDYRNTQSDKYYNQLDIRNYPENYLDELFTHDIRLMRMNVPQVIPFSDTLIQFLLWNAIDNLDTINLDMDRLLSSLANLYLNPDEKYYANYWYFRYREILSKYSKHNQLEYIDDNYGYVTSDVEALLNRRN